MELRSAEPNLIIISGKARSGKDTCATFIKEYYENKNKKVIILQLSHYLKEYIKVLTNWDGSEEEKPRKLLQELGTDIIRNKIDIDFFTKRTIEDIKVYSYFYDTIIVSDARFLNEITLIKNTFKNVITINIKRSESDELTLEEKTHISETALDNYNNYDYIINNDSSLEELKTKVTNILGGIK